MGCQKAAQMILYRITPDAPADLDVFRDDHPIGKLRQQKDGCWKYFNLIPPGIVLRGSLQELQASLASLDKELEDEGR